MKTTAYSVVHIPVVLTSFCSSVSSGCNYVQFFFIIVTGCVEDSFFFHLDDRREDASSIRRMILGKEVFKNVNSGIR